MSSILDFRGLYYCAALLPANNLRRISTIYVRGYLQGSENGRVVTIGHVALLGHIILILSQPVFLLLLLQAVCLAEKQHIPFYSL